MAACPVSDSCPYDLVCARPSATHHVTHGYTFPHSASACLYPLSQLPVPLECYTGPPEDNLDLLQLYFRALVTGALRPHWCPVLYAVAVAHINSFIFSQDPKSSVGSSLIFKGGKGASDSTSSEPAGQGLQAKQGLL